MPNLLLSTVCRPLGTRYSDSKSVGFELLHEQVTRAQGMFSPRCTIHHFSLEYIAHNLDHPTVVLQYPTEREFIRELKRGYDFVGLSFVLSTFHHLKRMSALVRRHAPRSKIILGGYGTVLGDEELAPHGDYFCREEGIAFLRKLLGEPEKPMPYDHPLIVNGLRVFSKNVGPNGMIFGGLGCPNGCDFCCTSHFFKRRHIRLLPEGDDVFGLVQRYRERYPGIKFTVLDEDFLLNQKRARRFLELVRRSHEPSPSMFVFASIKALSQYDVRELVEMGVSGVWIGYEGKRSGYAKQQGRDVRELFRELREHGIHILASMIIGFEYQTPEIIREEHEELLSLNPTFSQVLIYGPTPGTPFYERIMREGRLLKPLEEDRSAYYRRCTGFYGMVRHPSMSPEQLEALQQECFERDFKRLGPSLVRGIENWLLGYRKLIRDSSTRLRRRAQTYQEDILNALPIFLSAKLYGPSREARARASRLFEEIRGTWKINPVKFHLQSWGALALAGWTRLCLKHQWFQQPGTVRLAFRGA